MEGQSRRIRSFSNENRSGTAARILSFRAFCHTNLRIRQVTFRSPIIVNARSLVNSFQFYIPDNGLHRSVQIVIRKEHKAILAPGAELPPWQDFSAMPYDLRHSFCTMCRDQGVEINTCIKWMGHSDAKMILKIYDSVSDARFQREADKLNAMFQDPPPLKLMKKAE